MNLKNPRSEYSFAGKEKKRFLSEEKMPAVSLLIPTFNNAETIESTLLSCLSQSFTDIEVVVYDEISRDGTRDIVQRLAQSDPRVRFLSSETNSGAALAWRRLLHEARGLYCSLVFSDDLLLPDFVSSLVPTLEASERILVTGCSAYSETAPMNMNPKAPLEAQPDRRRVYPFETTELAGPSYALGILAGVFSVSPTCSLFRTDAARNYFENCLRFANPFGFDYERRAYGNDLALLAELALNSECVVQHGVPLVVLRDSPRSLTSNALKNHRYDFWLQYTWAAYVVFDRYDDASTAMKHLNQVVKDRLYFIDALAALNGWRRPCFFNPWRIVRAVFFMLRMDKRINKTVSAANLAAYVERCNSRAKTK